MRESILPTVKITTNSPKSPKDGGQQSKLYQLVYPAYLTLVCLVVFVLYTKVLGHFRPTGRMLAEQYEVAQLMPRQSSLHVQSLDPACSALQAMRVCSHQAAAEELSRGTGTMQAFRALWNAGIHCFDMDAVMTKDGQVLVTHPRRVQAVLRQDPNVPNDTDIQNLELQQVRKQGVDSDNFPGIVEVLEGFAGQILNTLDGAAIDKVTEDVARRPLMFLEFKDRAFNPMTVSRVNDEVKRLQLQRLVALVLVSDSQQEQLVAEGFPWDGLFIRGYIDAIQVQTGETVPEIPVIRPDLVGGHHLVQPSIKLPEMFFAELGSMNNHQAAFVWNIDDQHALQKAVNVSAVGLISNKPLTIQRQLGELKDQCSRQSHAAVS